MRNLFRRASCLFWQYPILWLPIIIVDPLVLGLNLLDKKLTHAIIVRAVTSHSVLGNSHEPMAPSSFRTLKIVLLTKPIDWGTHLIAFFLYACAMIVTFTLVTALRSKQKLSLGNVLHPIQKSFARLMFFSLKLLVAIGIAAIPFFLSIVVFFGSNGPRFISIPVFSYAFSMLAFSAVAYFMSPAAVKLLRTQNSEALAPETARQARISAVLAVIASIALYIFTVQIKTSFISSSTPWGRDLLYEVVASLVSAAPYIVLFIILSLLATEDEPDREVFGAEAEMT